MGEINLELTVANLRDPGRQREVIFLVDTGTSRAWIPKEIAEQIGIKAEGAVPLEMADGTIKEYEYGYCLFSFGGETVAGNVVIGPQGCEPLLGTHVLQDFRLIIDMERHRISRSRAMKAK